MKDPTYFGNKIIDAAEKAPKVARVFDTVAPHYDLMNDVMSLGIHRLWKAFTVLCAGIRPGFKVLDVAGGTGDLSRAFAKQVGSSGEVWLTDINSAMLHRGRDRLLNAGHILPTTVCDAEQLPFPTQYFDRVCVAFGLRNMTHLDNALREMHRVLKPGGKLLVLEFSQVHPRLRKLYDLYSFSVLPWLGEKIANNAASYRYLAESIRRHPDQQTLANYMEKAGFESVTYTNLTGGIVALHTGLSL